MPKDKPDVAYPAIAINAKIEVLSGLGAIKMRWYWLRRRCNERPITTWPDISMSFTKLGRAFTDEWASGIEPRMTTRAQSNM